MKKNQIIQQIFSFDRHRMRISPYRSSSSWAGVPLRISKGLLRSRLDHRRRRRRCLRRRS